MIKAVLALKHKHIPPSLHFEQPNPKIDFERSPFYVNTEMKPWQAGPAPRRAGVSSLGLGGTNAHVIVEEAPDQESPAPSRPFQLLVQSARTSSALEKMTANLREYLKNREENLSDIAYTLQIGRRAFSHRRVTLCKDRLDAIAALESADPKRVFTGPREAQNRPVAFMFPGGGAQYLNMAKGVYQNERSFRESVDICAHLLESALGYDLRDILFPPDEMAAAVAIRLRQISLALPALFVIEYALARLWMSWGVHPQAMIGHSLGEYVAACLAGVFSLEDALRVVAERGRLMEKMPPGAMLSLPLPQAQVEQLLGDRLSIAAINGPSLCSVSGSADAIEALASELAARGEEFHRLQIDVAAHSKVVEQIREEFSEFLENLDLREPTIAYISNVTGTWIRAEEATDPGYWADHLCKTVRFADGCRELLKDPEVILLEVGPGHTLSGLVRQHPEASRSEILCSLPHHDDPQPDEAFLLSTLGRLWVAGAEIDWPGFYENERRKRVALPTYAFERKRYWIEAHRRATVIDYGESSLARRQDIAEWFYIPSWKRVAMPSPPSTEGIERPQARWLIFEDTVGLGKDLARRLKAKGHDVVCVTKGSGFAIIEDRRYEVAADDPADYRLLLAELRAAGRIPDRIAHLWNVTGPGYIEIDERLSEELQTSAFRSLLYLAQALGGQSLEGSLRIAVISNDMQEVVGEKNLVAEKSLALGPCKVITQEYANIICQSIDLSLGEASGLDISNAADQLLTELNAEATDMVVAYRGNHRWVRIFEPLRLERSREAGARLRAGGVYLITGGLGGVGLELALYLAQTAQARLALVGRSSFPAREEWGNWLSDHGEGDEIRSRIEKLLAIEELGGEVLILKADVSNLEQMRRAIDAARDRFGNINGVIHASGVAQGNLIELQTPEVINCHMAAKVKGSRVLESLLGESKLDFLVLCSSQSSMLGGIGLSGYCAANAFLDAFSYYYASKYDTFAVSINWDRWQGLGMAVGVEAMHKKLTGEDLQGGMTAEEGKDAFSRILCDATTHQVVVSVSNFITQIEHNSAFTATSALKEIEQAQASGASHPRPFLNNAYEPPRNDMERFLVEVFQELLGIDQVGIHDNFFELGGHSLLATRLISRVRSQHAADITLKEFFATPTVSELSDLLELQIIANSESAKFDELMNILEQLDEEKAEHLVTLDNQLNEG